VPVLTSVPVRRVSVSSSSSSDPNLDPLPRHLAIIMDGNGRWARARGLPRSLGHRAGLQALKRTLNSAQALGIEYVTVFAFSSENWQRPLDEVSELMRLLRHYLRSEIAELHQRNVRLRVIGDRTKLSDDIREMIAHNEALTANNTGGNLVVALSYGGRAEIVQAAQALSERVARGELNPADITEEMLGGAMETADIPPPDLILRTSGEQRLSNFLLWQAAYAEFVFVDQLWPDFGEEDLRAVLQTFARRDRRFGRVASAP